MAKCQRQIGTVLAFDDNGNQHVLAVFQTFIKTTLLSGISSEIPGIQSLYTQYGDDVNRLSKGQYQVVQSGLRLSSNDPEAI